MGHPSHDTRIDLSAEFKHPQIAATIRELASQNGFEFTSCPHDQLLEFTRGDPGICIQVGIGDDLHGPIDPDQQSPCFFYGNVRFLLEGSERYLSVDEERPLAPLQRNLDFAHKFLERIKARTSDLPESQLQARTSPVDGLLLEVSVDYDRYNVVEIQQEVAKSSFVRRIGEFFAVTASELDALKPQN